MIYRDERGPTVREVLMFRLRLTPAQRKRPHSGDIPIGVQWSWWQSMGWRIGVTAMDSPLIFAIAVLCVIYGLYTLF